VNEIVNAQGGTLARVEMFTPEDVDLIKRTVATKANDTEFKLFMHICQHRRLNPLLKQVYFTKYKDNSSNEDKMAIVTSVDGFRLTAQRTGQYAGQVGPFWCGPDGKWLDVWTGKGQPFAAKVGVLIRGNAEPIWGIALWSEFGNTRNKWKTMPAHMLAKCAETHALRKAFPEELSGLATEEEIHLYPEQPKPNVVVSVPGSPEAADEKPEPAFDEDAFQAWRQELDTIAHEQRYAPEEFDAVFAAILRAKGFTDAKAVPVDMRARFTETLAAGKWEPTRAKINASKKEQA
jgi:phage recombination protein Bet